MSLDLPRRTRQLEFALATVLIASASWYLLDVLTHLQEEAEKLLVETTVRNMNSGLFLAQARWVAAGRENDVPALAGINPVDWLGRPPEGYIGARDCTASGVLAPGQWCWDAVGRTLYYWPRRTDGLKIDGAVPWLTWRVNHPPDPRAIRPGTLRVVSAGRYIWRP